MTAHPIFKILKQQCFIVFAFILFGHISFAQSSIRDYAIFGGKKDLAPPQTIPPAPGYGVQLGASTTIQGGSVGSYHLVKTTGAANIGTISNPTNIYSGGIIQLAANNTVTGKITAANQYTLPSNLSSGSTILTVGTGSTLGNNFGGTYTQGNIDVNGSINIGISGSSVLGNVTIPPDKAPPGPIKYTYSGPTPAGGLVRGTPNLPTLPQLPDTVIFPSAGSTNITSGNVTPGFYGNLTIGGNATVKLTGPGTYVFNSITSTGPNSQLIFDFISPATTGNFIIYVYGNVVLNRLSTTVVNGGPNTTENTIEIAKRIYTVTHGKGAVAWDMSNGSNGNSNTAVWLGTIYAPFGAITLGTPTGPSSFVTGALWSGTQVNVQGSTTVTYAPFPVCIPPNADAGPDKPLNIIKPIPITTLTGSSTTPGVTFSWQALNGGVITSPTNTSTITVSEDGTYVLTVYSDADCFSRDTVVVTNPIGDELKSIFLNNTATSPFFMITPDGYIMIDVICNVGQRATVLNLLQQPQYGLRNIQPNGVSQFIITGEFQISKLPSLNFVQEINYCRPYYQEIVHSGVVTSVGDTSVRSWLVRNGYDLDGEGIKIGVISNSFNTIPDPTLAPFNTNTADQSVANNDLPGIGSDSVIVVGRELEGIHSDEGRAMLDIIHDLAPRAKLYFRTGSRTAGDFAKGIYQLDSAGCNIIVDDLTYITEQFLTDGIVAQAVDSVTTKKLTNKTTYISAAGNFASKSYESSFDSVPAPPGFTGTAHNFAPAGQPRDIYQRVTFKPGKYIIVLQWVDENYSIGNTIGTRSDLDIFTTPNTDGTQLYGNNRINLRGDPIEILTFTVTSPDTTNILIVNKTPGTKPERIKYTVFKGDITFEEYPAVNSTVVGQANANGALAIGAARFNKLDSVEFFSSTGGTTVFTKIGASVVPQLRKKPDLIGPDGVSTTVKMSNTDLNGDSYSDFFGTSAAAPHAAAVAALIMQGRKKFLLQPVTTPTEIKDLLTISATNMYPTLDISGSDKFDFVSGYGFINADSAMRAFANPKPSLDQLIKPAAGQTNFTIKGNNFSSNSEIYYGDLKLEGVVILNSTEAIAPMPVLSGNKPIWMKTLPKSVSGLDGGRSDSLYFDSQTVQVIAKDTARKYGEVKTLVPTIFVNGVLLENTNPKLTLRDLGLKNLTLKVPIEATNPGDIGTYKITFSQTSPDDRTLLQKYNYEFIEGTLTIEKLPVTITVQNMSVEFGTKIPNPTFTYQFDETNIPDPDALISSLSSEHQSQLVSGVLGLVNGEAVVIENGEAVVIENGEAVVIENGQAYALDPNTLTNDSTVLIPIVNAQSLNLDPDPRYPTIPGRWIVTNIINRVLSASEIERLSFLATTKSLQDTRIVNSNTVVDITQESILDFIKNAAQTQMTNSISSADPKGLVDVNSYTNGEAVVIENGEAVVIENGEAVVIENGEAVVIENGEAVVIENSKVLIENGEAVVIDNGEAVVIENGEAVVIENAAVIIENGEAVVIDNNNPSGPHYPYRYSNGRNAVIVDKSDIGKGLSQLKSLNIITGLSIGNQFLMPGTLTNNNLDVKYVAGIVNIIDPCPILTRKPFTNFGSTTQNETSLWVSVTTKISRQLANGDSLLFKSGSVTFNNITAFDQGTNTPITTKTIPDGVIIADASVGTPKTSYENGMWITRIPVPFASTSDIFITGGIITSNNKGFKKQNGANTVVKGQFYSNTCTPFSDQWTYAIAAYQPKFDYPAIDDLGSIISVNSSINGTTLHAGTPLPFVNAPSNQTHLVNGGSGGGGNNYTGSTSSYENYTACAFMPRRPACSSAVTRASNLNQEESQVVPSAGEVQIMPNPATNYITLSFVPTHTGNSDITLFNIDGRKVFEINYGICEAEKRYVKNIDVNKLANGVYIVKLRSVDKVTIKKIIIRR